MLAAYPTLTVPVKRAQQYFVYLLVFLTGLPIIAIMIPTYDFFVTANFINSKFWTVWFMTATALPFGTWIARSFIDAVPRELEEAAWIDGTSRLWLTAADCCPVNPSRHMRGSCLYLRERLG